VIDEYDSCLCRALPRLLSVVLCYFVSMLTSGLFARPFYRLYSGLLIGICSLMLLSPGLRWLALSDPQLAVLALTLAQYGVFRGTRLWGVPISTVSI
jgi:hypothetical protein